MDKLELNAPPLPLKAILRELRELQELGYRFDNLLSRFLIDDDGAHLREL